MRKPMWTAGVGLVVMLLLAGCAGVGPSTPASLTVNPKSLDFGADEVELFVAVGNAGQETLNWTVAVEEGADWLSALPSAGVDKGTVSVKVDRTGLAAGVYSASLLISSNGGSETVSVVMTVTDRATPPGAVPGQVHNLDVRGVTMPAELAVRAAASPSSEARSLRDAMRRADELFAEAGGALSGAGGAFSVAGGALSGAGGARVMTGSELEMAQIPAGFAAAFVLSWDAVDGAAGYKLFRHDGRGYVPVAEVSVAELEDPSDPVYMLTGSYEVGEEGTFRVQAVNAAGGGEPSAPDTGVIIDAQRLLAPGDGSTAPSKPTFLWRAHGAGTGYILTLAQGDVRNHLWQQVLAGGGETEQTFPGDDAGAGDALAPGEYLWYVVTQGPTDSGPAMAYAFSPVWSFEVK